MAFDIPYFHADRAPVAEIYRGSEKSLPSGDDGNHLRKSDKRRDDGAPAPSPVSNFSPSAAITSNVSFDIHTALTGKVDFAYALPGHRSVRNIPPAAPQRAEQAQSKDHDALKKEAHRLALEIRKHRQHKLLIEAGLVEGDTVTIEEIDGRIEKYESRLREIAGASPVVSAVVRKKAIPLTEVTGEYTSIEKILAKKRALLDKFYATPHERQKRQIEKQIQRTDAELVTIFTAMTQSQETAENENGHEKPHEKEKRLSKTTRLMAETRHALRLVSRKWERIDASYEANKLRHSLRDLSTEREALFKNRRAHGVQAKRENDRREMQRRQKAIPEYWDDRDNADAAMVHDEIEEARINDLLDDFYHAMSFDDHEAEYQTELAEYEAEQRELAAFFEQGLDTEDGDTYEEPEDDGDEEPLAAEA